MFKKKKRKKTIGKRLTLKTLFLRIIITAAWMTVYYVITGSFDTLILILAAELFIVHTALNIMYDKDVRFLIREFVILAHVTALYFILDAIHNALLLEDMVTERYHIIIYALVLSIFFMKSVKQIKTKKQKNFETESYYKKNKIMTDPLKKSGSLPKVVKKFLVIVLVSGSVLALVYLNQIGNLPVLAGTGVGVIIGSLLIVIKL